METKSVFDNISTSIIQQIRKADNAINICVPWLTDDDILKELVNKSKQKIYIQLLILNDEYNNTKKYFFNQLISNNSRVYMVDKTNDGGMLHHKFCTIDRNILIIGSYNWSNNAKRNDENILINIATELEDCSLISDYDNQFQKLLYKYEIEIEDEDRDWDEVEAYTSASQKKQEEAKVYYNLAHNLCKEENYVEALNNIVEGMKKLPYPDENYYLLAHVIQRSDSKFLDCTDYLYKYLSQIAINDFDTIHYFKKIYEVYKTRIIDEGKITYRFIDKINYKTQVNLGSFASRNIEPHFFVYEELDTLPF